MSAGDRVPTLTPASPAPVVPWINGRPATAEEAAAQSRAYQASLKKSLITLGIAEDIPDVTERKQ